VVFLCASFLVGWLVVGYITEPVRTMADCVDLLLPGKPIPPELDTFSTRDNELGRLSRSFVAMKVRLDESFGALESSLSEKDVLLKEVHHRVKNNLQIVSSILSIQSGTLDDENARTAFEECQDRIQAMALVHEEVYRTGSFVELGMYGYLNQICETLGWGRNRGTCATAIDVQADELAALSLDKAIPCGLVVNELVTNALKHAFAGRKLGTIAVTFDRHGDTWRLSVTDDGIGRKTSTRNHDAVAISTGKGIGEQLVVGLVAQLSGTLRYETPPGGGTTVKIEFPA
jgi:two-component sensor histidine kinase